MNATQPDSRMRELISDLMDNQLCAGDCDRVLQAANVDRRLWETWSRYHMIGDAMRAADLVQNASDVEFAERLCVRVTNVDRSLRPYGPEADEAGRRHRRILRDDAANGASFRVLVGGLGVLAIAVTLAWFGGSGALTRAVESEAISSPVLTMPATLAESNTTSIMIRDPHLDQLLAAHRQSGGGTALQGPAGFIRNATFQEGQGK